MIVSDRQTAGGAADLFAASPQLAVFLRCAMDIRNVDVAAASAAGVLVTHASAGFGTAVAEWVLGAMIDLSRGISDSVLAYRAGARTGHRRWAANCAAPRWASSATGRSAGAWARWRQALRHARGWSATRMLRSRRRARIEHARHSTRCWRRPTIVVCLAPALPETENLMNAAALRAR